MSLTENLLSSLSILAKSTQPLDTPLTIEGEILSLEDAGIGKYKVQYLGNTITVYSQNPNITYSKGDVVCILVPNGDLANENKIILRSTSSSTAPYTSVEDKTNYFILSDNVLGSVGNLSLCTYKTETKEVVLGTSEFNQIVSKYMEEGHRTFKFSVKVKTNIEDVRQRVNGNYGMTLLIPIVENGEQSVKSYTFDINNMIGEVYAFNDWTLQELYFTLPDTITLANEDPHIFIFVKDFVQAPNKPDDIFFKEVSLCIAEAVPEEAKNGYYLRLNATEGPMFLEGTYQTRKTITPTLYSNGNETSIDGYDCYWFVEDASVKLGGPDYSAKGGPGWRILNKKINCVTNEDGTSSFAYKLDDYSIDIEKNKIHSSMQYKCVVSIRNVLVGNTINIINLDSPVKINLVSATGSNEFIQGTGNVDLICQVEFDKRTPKLDSEFLSYEWTFLNSREEYISNDFYNTIRINDEVNRDSCYFETEITFPTSYIEENNIVICTAYLNKTTNSGTETELLGNAKISLKSIYGSDYIVSMQNNNVIYKYDADGDSPMVADYDGPAAGIKDIAPFNFKVFKLNGQELTDIEYRYCKTKWSLPKNSMMIFNQSVLDEVTGEDEDYYYINGHGRLSIEYSIASKYDAKKSNNTILLEIDFDGNLLYGTAVASFLKDGMGGTNGTKFAAVIQYEGYPYGVRDALGQIRKLRLAFAADTKQWYRYNHETKTYILFDNPRFSTLVYRDGEATTDYSITRWDMLDHDNNHSGTNPFFEIDSSSSVLTQRTGIDWSEEDTESTNIVKLTLRVGDEASSISGNGEDLYVYYPIETTRVAKLEYLRLSAPMINGGFDNVLYATDGSNPRYDNNEPFVCEDDLCFGDAKNLYEFIWSTTQNLKRKDIANTTKEDWITPVTIYDNGITNNFIKVQIKANRDKINSIQEKLNEAKKEYYTNLYDTMTINANKEVLQAIGEKYYYTKWQNDLNSEEIQESLSKKVAIQTSIESIQKSIAELYEYVNETSHIKILDYIDFNEITEEKNSQVNEILNVLFSFNYSSTQGTLETLESITLTEEDIENLKNDSSLTLGIVENVITLVDTYNYFADNYNTLKDTLIYSNKLYGIYREYSQFLFKFIEYGINRLPDTISVLPTATADNEGDMYIYNGVDDVANNLYPGYCYQSTLYTAEDSEESVYYWKVIYLDKRIYSIFPYLTDLYVSFTRVEDNLLSLDGVKTIFNKINNVLCPEFYEIINSNVDISTAYFNVAERDTSNAESAAQEAYKLVESYSNLLAAAQERVEITHVKPILLSYNRYEMSNINGWDGNKLYTGPNDEYILAPQVGAGKKNEDNTFTGMVMGIRKQSDTTDVGLFGYSSGAQSIFLDAMTGTATFGTSGTGQIIIDPKAGAKIYSAGYNYTGGDGGTGMMIDLMTPEIKWGNGRFWVDKDGTLHAGGGSSAGWNIREHEFASGNNNAFLNSTGYGVRDTDRSGMLATWIKGTYERDPDTGKLIYDENGKPVKEKTTWANTWIAEEKDPVTGEVVTPAHWGYSSKKNSYNPKGKIYLGPDGISVSNQFRVDNEGNLEVGKLSSDKHWLITVNGDESFIGYNAKELLKLKSDGKANNNKSSVYLGTDGFSIGQKFKVDNDGSLELGLITGKHWKINSNSNGSYIYHGDVNNIADLTVQYLRLNRNGRDKDVYIGTDGVVIGSMLSITTDKGTNNKITLGDMSVKSDGTRNKYWCVGSKNGHTYFAYDTNGDFGYNMGAAPFTLEPNQYTGPESIYIGTDGIRIGTVFKALSRGDGRTSAQISIGATRERRGMERCFKVGTTDTGAGVESWFYSNRGKSFSGQDTMVTQFCAFLPKSHNRHDLLIGTDGIRIGQKFCYVYNGLDYQGYIMDDLLVGHREDDGTITWAPLSEYGGGSAALPRVENYYF